MLRGIKGDEDTAIVVTTGHFTPDAENEARPGQGQRLVYLIDGNMLVDVCKRNQIGVKKVVLPELLVLDPEVRSPAQSNEPSDDSATAKVDDPQEHTTKRRLRDSMLGDSERGLSVKEVAELTGHTPGTVKNYLCTKRRKVLGDAIRGNPAIRTRALALISAKRQG
jgi:hypothetical protein